MSDYVDLGNLVRVAVVSLGFASLLALVFSVGIVGASRGTVDGERRPLPLVLAGLAFGLFAAAIVAGIVIMTRK